MRHRKVALIIALAIVALAVGWSGRFWGHSTSGPAGSGISARPPAKPYLNMPHSADGRMPPLLSQTGAFSDTRHLIADKSLIPYDLIVAFWWEGAFKSRGFALPNAKIKFSATGQWQFPAGTVFIKNFELPIDATDPSVKRRLETRLLILDSAGGAYGVTYKWRADESAAELLKSIVAEDFPLRGDGKGPDHKIWYAPSRKDGLSCHTVGAGGVLGV